MILLIIINAIIFLISVCFVFYFTIFNNSGRYFLPPDIFLGFILVNIGALLFSWIILNSHFLFFSKLKNWLHGIDFQNEINLRNMFILICLIVVSFVFVGGEVPFGKKFIFNNYLISLILNLSIFSLSAIGLFGWFGSLIRRKGLSK